MLNAVVFSGNNYLQDHTVPEFGGGGGFASNFDARFQWNCGNIHYSFATTTFEFFNILYVFDPSPTKVRQGGHIIRVLHLGEAEIDLFLQQRQPDTNESLGAKIFTDDLSLFDGNPHTVRIGWNIGIDPWKVTCYIDGVKRTNIQIRNIIANLPTGLPTNPPFTLNCGVQASGLAAQCVIGAEPPRPSEPGAVVGLEYAGSLSRVVCYLSNNDYTDADHNLHCEAVDFRRQTVVEPIVPYKSAALGSMPQPAHIVAPNYYVFCGSEVPGGFPFTFDPRDPRFAQLHLSGPSPGFNVNWGGNFPPGMLPVFFDEKNGSLQNTSSSTPNAGAADLSLGANLTNTSQNAPAVAPAGQPSGNKLPSGLYQEPLALNGMTVPPLGPTAPSSPLGPQTVPTLYLHGGPVDFQTNNATADYTATTETPKETLTVNGNLSEKNDAPPKSNLPRAVTLVPNPNFELVLDKYSQLLDNRVLIVNAEAIKVPTDIAPCGILSFWYKTHLPPWPSPSPVWIGASQDIITVFQQAANAINAMGRSGPTPDDPLFRAKIFFKGPPNTNAPSFTPYAQLVLQFVQGNGLAVKNLYVGTIAPIPMDNTWHHILASWNLGGPAGSDPPLPSSIAASTGGPIKFQILIDGMSISVQNVGNDLGTDADIGAFSLNWSKALGYEIGSTHAGDTGAYYGGLAELYLWIGTPFVDLINTKIASSFINKNKKAVELLFDGSGPLGGVKPLIYLSGNTDTFFNSPGPNGPKAFGVDTDVPNSLIPQNFGINSTSTVIDADDDPFENKSVTFDGSTSITFTPQ